MPDGLSLSVLGAYVATTDGQPLARFPTVRAQALLIYLAAESAFGAAAQRRETLMELLWPGMPPSSGRKNLRQTIYYLRQVLGDRPGSGEGEPAIPFLLADRYTVEINRDYPYWLDLAHFLHLLDGSEEDWREAAELYRGDFLVDFSPDGQYAASGSQDASAIVWDVESGELLRRWSEPGGSVIGVDFSQDGRQLWLATADGEVNAWELVLDLDELLAWTADNRYVRDLTCSEKELYQLAGQCD